MKSGSVLSCLLVAILLPLGCREPQPLQPDAAKISAENTPVPLPVLPGGYYSFFLEFDFGGYNRFARINTSTGKADPLWSIGLTPEQGLTPLGLAFDVDGSMYTTLNYMSFVPEECYSRFARVDTETGAVTFIGPTFPMNTCGGDIDACGNYYVTGMDVPHLGYIHGDGYLYRFDKQTGLATQIGFTGMTDWMDMAFDSQGRLWSTTQNKLFVLDTETGAASFVTDIYGVPDADPPRNMEVMSIAFDKNDVLYGFGVTVYYDDPRGSPVMQIDATTGVATLLGYSYTQWYGHGGDFMPTQVRVCHVAGRGRYVPIKIGLESLAAHQAHGDIVPGLNGASCDCPTATAGGNVGE